MEEEEDTYGFGSFSDLFDAGPAPTAKRLDVGALSRFCMSERLLSRFQQQQPHTFQHVAAKFDGVGIDGGLGALALASLEGGGVVWQQTPQSDSDALERRKKELQDITNRQDGGKSAAALFVALRDVAKVRATTVQNTVRGLEMQLVDGNRLELTFMPGPFAASTHRDEFLAALKEQMDAAAAAGPKQSASVERKSPGAEQKEKFRRLVRRYTTLDQLSGEGLEIAKLVHAGTGYHLGPTTKHTPKFAADSEYRKKTVEKLTDFLEQMNKEWSDADAHRQLHTKAKHSRNDDDLFEYTDTDTGALIPTRQYEQRYLKYAKAHEVDPVLHLFPVPEKSMKADTSAQNGTSTPARRSKSAESSKGEARIPSLFAATFGTDVSSSCIIGDDFFTSGKSSASTEPPTFRVEDTAFRAAVDNARKKLWNSWSSVFTQIPGNQAEPRRGHSKSHSQVTAGAEGHSSMRKRTRERRRSLVMPTADDLQATAEATETKILQDANDTQSRIKRSRSAAQMSDAAQRARRKARRQSIVSAVDLPVTMKVEEKKPSANKRRTPQSPHKSPRPRLAANSYARETSALEMVGDEDSDICRLCYNERALVHMNPCDHVVCASCWSRLSPSSGSNGTASSRACPWDREPVTKR